MSATPTAIVLAAGRGARFRAAGGRAFKQTLVLDTGATLLEAVCDRYAECGLPVVCALHPELEALRQPLEAAGHRVVMVADADLGMGHSIAATVRATDPDGCLVALADMPRIHRDTIARVAKALVDGAVLCAPVHGGRRGHPVGFAKALCPELTRLGGDRGARRVLESHAAELVEIPVDDPGIHVDIDTPEQATATFGSGSP